MQVAAQPELWRGPGSSGRAGYIRELGKVEPGSGKEGAGKSEERYSVPGLLKSQPTVKLVKVCQYTTIVSFPIFPARLAVVPLVNTGGVGLE